MSTFDSLIADLARDVQRVQPKDALQFCANWFQSRLEEQRARTRDILSQRSTHLNVSQELYADTQPSGRRSTSPFPPPLPTPTAIHRSSMRASIANSPFGALNVPGNALLQTDAPNPTFRLGPQEQPPTSPLSSTLSPFNRFDSITPTEFDPNDFLHPPNSAIFQRRTSVCAESIDVDAYPDASPPYFPKTPEQVGKIRDIVRKLFIFRGLAEDQEKAVLDAMQERFIKKGEVLIRQGDVGDAFYVIQSGKLHVFIKDDKPPAGNVHPVLGRKVAECPAGSSVGELALLYGHPRAASVLAMEDSHLWSLDRMTFRTIVLKLAHRRRMMYEGFLSGVELLSSLDAQQRSKIADALNREVYKSGTTVVVEGDPGQDKFFLIEDGEAIVTQQGKEINRLKKGDYFGGEIIRPPDIIIPKVTIQNSLCFMKNRVPHLWWQKLNW